MTEAILDVKFLAEAAVSPEKFAGGNTGDTSEIREREDDEDVESGRELPTFMTWLGKLQLDHRSWPAILSFVRGGCCCAVLV